MQAYKLGINEEQRKLLLRSVMITLGHRATATLDEHEREACEALRDMLRDLPAEEQDDPGATHMFYL